MKNLSPFPNQGEIIRYLASALDLKAGNKAIDDYASKGDSDWQLREKMVDEVFYRPISQSIGENIAGFFRTVINRFLDSYLGMVKKISLDGVPRAVSLPLLAKHYFSAQMSIFLNLLTEVTDGPPPAVFVISGYSAIKAIIRLFEANIPGWKKSHSVWSKERKDRLASWCKEKSKGGELPAYGSVMLLPAWLKEGGASLDNGMMQQMQYLLLIARAIEWTKQGESGIAGVNAAREYLCADEYGDEFAEALSLAKLDHNKKYGSLKEMALALNDLLFQQEKSANAQQATRTELDELKGLQLKVDPDGLADYYLNWLEAKWHVYAGDLKQALDYYKKAFEQSLYTAGENQQGIIDQAMVVAGRVKDRAFLKRLKNQAIVFGWFVEPTADDDSDVNNHRSRSRSNVVEDWEVDAFSANLDHAFPQRSMFVGCYLEESVGRIGPLMCSDFDAIKPDYRNPGRKIKVGEGWQKTMPQLVWFTLINKPDVVKKLLDKGASVDAYSDAGDTPILMAVQHMDATNMPYSTLDDSCFKLISAVGHRPETINTKTAKKKLLPLVCAVGSGKSEVVKKLLQMGANVHLRGETDNRTALYQCLHTIAKLRDSEAFTADFKKHNPSTAVLESMRRYSAGMTGFTLAHLHSELERARHNKAFQYSQTAYADVHLERITSLLTLDVMRKIGHILLDAGADPDAEHNSAIKGYTSLMLAAELDEAELFERMLALGASPLKSYNDPGTGQQINCWLIAINFGSSKVLALLKEKHPDYRGV